MQSENRAAVRQPCRHMERGSSRVQALSAYLTDTHSLAPPPRPHTQDTSFYAESGGQCADTGAVAAASGAWPVEVGPNCLLLLAIVQPWWSPEWLLH